MVTINFSDKQFRRLLDMVYIGNWVLNSTRGEDRFKDYDRVLSHVFAHCLTNGMEGLASAINGKAFPSRAFEEGGIHEAIMDYEDTIFFEILAEEMARRDMDFEPIDISNYDELTRRIDEYIAEFEENGIENITLDK